MKAPPFDCAVVVLGMHRSGTSALAGVLARCGLGVPEHLIAASGANERGFYESEPINALNNAMLADCGQTWLSLTPVGDDCWIGDDAARRRDQLRALVGEEFASTRMPVIKDPRICRLFPLWEQALGELAREIRVALIIRSPVEVARSLERRNQIEIELGLLLWARYNLDAERYTRHLPRRFLNFGGLIDDWRSSLDKLDLPLQLAASDSAAIDEFLSGALRHHQDEVAQLKGVQLVTELFEILSRWTVDGERKKDYPALDSLRDKLDEIGPVLSVLSEKGRLERKRRTSLAAKAGAVEAQLDRREAQFIGVAGSIERSLREIDKRSVVLNRQAQQLGEDFARSIRLVEEKDQAVRALTVENERLESAIARNMAQAEEQSKELIAAGEERQKLLDRLAQLEIASARADGLAAELLAVRAAAGEVDTELRLVKKKYRSTQAILQRERIRGQKLEGQIEQAQAKIRQLETGIAFRLTKTVSPFARRIANILASRGVSASRRQRVNRLIRESEYFDASWYLENYPDVAAARVDPAIHFADLGWREGRNPSAAFCTTRYLRRYPDVAELGINPLLHFIEHGSFEGREVQGVGELSVRVGGERRGIRANLAPAIPVYSAQRDRQSPLAWLRACRLVSTDHAIILDGLGLATTSSAQMRTAFETMVADFEALSGGAGELSLEPLAVAKLPRLQDGWFATSHRLFTRWSVTQPTVIRALQVDPHTEKLTLVGEALATGVLDPISLDLASPTMPLLFIATASGGDLLGARTMAFPSLLRGAFHYPELVATSDNVSSIDAMEFSAELESQLRFVRASDSHPAVKAIDVDLTGSDGTGPLFHRDVRDLLGRVLMVDMSSSGKSEVNNRELYLRDSVGLTARHPCRRGGGRLSLAADMVPALGILVSSLPEAQRANRNIAMGLIVSDIDPSQPAVRFDPPAAWTAIGKIESGSYPLPFPRLRGGLARAQLAAIRQLSRPLDDAEYLMPDMSITADKLTSEASVDWLIDPGRWDEALLAQSIAALSLQKEVSHQRLLFTRQPSPFVRTVARSSFASEPAVFDGLDAALAGSNASLVGYLGSGIVVHDARTVAILSSLLLDSNASSASCVLVAAAKQGKSWRTRLVDGGSLSVDSRVVFGPRANSPTEMIWRATYPVIEPPRLWLARSEDVRRWRSGDHIGKEIHLVTSVISASLEGEQEADLNELSGIMLPATAGRSISAKVLVG